MIESFLKEIQDLNYVVQRNWNNLPGSMEVDGHTDLDLFCSDDDKPKIVEKILKYPQLDIDVRSYEDNYYPEVLAHFILSERKRLKELFYVPNPQTHFAILYYHNLVHKNDNPYGEKLGKLFLKMFPTVRCVDPGVGYYHGSD